MKRLLCILIFHLFCVNGFTQNCDTSEAKKLYLRADTFLSKDVTYALKLAVKANDKLKSCNKSKHYYKSILTLSRAYYLLDKPDSVLSINLRALSEIPADMPDLYKAKLNHQIGSAYTMLMQLENALKYSLSALKIYERVNDRAGQTNILVNICNIYQQQYNFSQAEKFIRQAEKAAHALADSVVLGNVYNTMGILYAEHQQLDSAEKFFLRSTKIRETLNDKTSIVWNYSNLGGVYALKKQPREAITFFEKAYSRFEEDSNFYGLSSVALNLGESYLQLKDFKKSLQYYQYARSLCEMTGDLDNLENLYNNLSVYYDEIGDLKTAFRYSDSLIVLKDTIYGKRLDESMAEMQTKYDVEKKDLEIQKHKAEIDLQEKQNQIKTIVIIGVLILLIVLVLAGILFYRKKQIENKARAAAELANEKEIRTKAIVEAEEKERRRIAQDLHDGVGQILSAAKLNLSSLQSKIKLNTPEEKEAMANALSLVDDSVKEVRTVSHSMMPNTLLKLGLASAVKEFVTKMGNLPNLKVDLEIVGMDKRLDDQTETVLYRVIQEVVNNIIKHSNANTINLQLIRHEDELTVMIEDNGIGFDTAKINEFGGIGLKNIISRIEFLNGTVHFDSTPGKGTSVVVEIPLNK